MKRLKKYGIDSLGNFLEVLNGFEMQGVIAGDGENWDCLFNCFIYTYKLQTGITLDHDTLVNQYISATGKDPQEAGGAVTDSFMDFISSKYGYCATQTPTNNQGVTPWASFALDNSGILHYAIPLGPIEMKDGTKKIKCIDPSLPAGQQEVWYPVDAWKGTFNVGPCDVNGSTGSYSSSTGSYYYA